MKLASVEKITKLEPIAGADLIEKATVLGWPVVVRKGEFNVGDKVCYIRIDTVAPELPEYEFLRKRKFRVRTIKLREQVSQGLIMPLPKWQKSKNFCWDVGEDILPGVCSEECCSILFTEGRQHDRLGPTTGSKRFMALLKPPVNHLRHKLNGPGASHALLVV